MKYLPTTSDATVLRTDFSDQAAWEAVRDAIRRPSPEGFEAYVEFVDDKAFAGWTTRQLLAAVPAGYPHAFVVVVDRKAIADPQHPLLVVNLCDDGRGSAAGAEFRALPAQVQSIENNLSIANMDFAEFASAADPDGVLRGF